MADIVNGGIIVLVAAFCLVAVVGGIDQLRDDGGPLAGFAGADADSDPALGPEPSEAPEVRTPTLGRFADDRGDDRHGGQDRGQPDDRHGDEGRERDKKDDADKEQEKEKDEEEKEREEEKEDDEDEEREKEEEDDEDDGD